MVAVSGSLAIDNATSDSDIDLFCITDRRRLWITRLWLVFLSKLTRVFSNTFPRYLCPNYLLTLEALHLEDRNLFTAYEAVQAVPLWGQDVYNRFIEANAWMGEYLPHRHADLQRESTEEYQKPVPVRACEWFLEGKIGDTIDRMVFRLFRVGYRKRAQRRNWTWSQLRDAYRRDRYTVPEGGYIRVVRGYFQKRVNEYLGEEVSVDRLTWLFPGTEDEDERYCYNWEELFEEEYGQVTSSCET
jgi:hypothetical protein